MNKLRNRWEPYLHYGQLFNADKNKVIYRQGEKGKGFYYLRKGEIKITLLSDKGDERIINIVPSGMLFGEHGIQGEQYLTSAITILPSEIYFFSDDVYTTICKKHSNAAEIYTDSLIYKFRTLADIITFMDSPVEHQMAYYLIKLAEENGKVSMNQTAFSKYIGASRITVNKVIQKWKKANYITLINRQILIKDMNKLKAIIDND
ncbi:MULTISPECIES: Crp/Fnr family transcriptional regulator [Bacillaceae]|uniref:Crp/Fnr family transcriptional regulator n=1 Tax=Bacillaceae TaxID=186817 RepID=UPI000BA58DD5|nr:MULTISPECIES: Crp/Fnr family transcriptional regulator [Bacillaceae]PAE26578.1 Crp/Fnr family transcriptional regulator [Bacillus sp. 7894-2]URM31507.1 Crp/Fnr family transcriptional regulator [Cytobacillus firmus]